MVIGRRGRGLAHLRSAVPRRRRDGAARGRRSPSASRRWAWSAARGRRRRGRDRRARAALAVPSRWSDPSQLPAALAMAARHHHRLEGLITVDLPVGPTGTCSSPRWSCSCSARCSGSRRVEERPAVRPRGGRGPGDGVLRAGVRPLRDQRAARGRAVDGAGPSRVLRGASALLCTLGWMAWRSQDATPAGPAQGRRRDGRAGLAAPVVLRHAARAARRRDAGPSRW